MKPETKVPPELKPDDLVEFVENHRPRLKAGDYQARATQTLQIDLVPSADFSSDDLDFSVQGERLSLGEENFHAVFPPPGARGKFGHALPHVILNRSTLPWERSPLGGVEVDPESPSWLALLLFTEQEAKQFSPLFKITVQSLEQLRSKGNDVADSVLRNLEGIIGREAMAEHEFLDLLDATLGQVQTEKFKSLILKAAKISQVVTTGELTQKPARHCFPQDFALESGQHESDRVSVIDVPWKLLKTILPHYHDLAVTAHVRRVGRNSRQSGEAALKVIPGAPPDDDDSADVSAEPTVTDAPADVWNPIAPELALIIGNRLPPMVNPLPPGDIDTACIVHLVSLEARYRHLPPPELKGLDPCLTRPTLTLDNDQLGEWLQYARAKQAADHEQGADHDFDFELRLVAEEKATLWRIERKNAEPVHEEVELAGTDPLKPLEAAEVATMCEAMCEAMSRQIGSDWTTQLDPMGEVKFTAPFSWKQHSLGRIGVELFHQFWKPANSTEDQTNDLSNHAPPISPRVKWRAGRFRLLHPEPVFDAQGANDTDRVRIISLKSWKFYCEAEKRGFTEELTGLNHANTDIAEFHVPLSTLSDDASALSPSDKAQASKDKGAIEAAMEQGRRYLRSGAVPLRHGLRGGGRTFSWYHGPFISDARAQAQLSLPARGPDELLIYNQSLGMFDVSYAAAWELGRLTVLEDNHFAMMLYHWKRDHSRTLAHLRQKIDHDYLPLVRRTPDARPPDCFAHCFRSLTLLEDLPFNYLVPDERLLPTESIRFFTVDSMWLECLRDGAFSVGRVLAKDHLDDTARSKDLEPPPRLSGFLLRSKVVSDWQQLAVDGYTGIDDLRGKHVLEIEPNPNCPKLTLERFDRLGPNVLLCLFSDPHRAGREIEMVDIHLPPEVLHFGLEEEKHGDPNQPPKLMKQLRDPRSGEELTDQTVKSIPWRSVGARNVIDLSALYDEVANRLAPILPKFTAADFSLQMLDLPPLVRFVRPSKSKPRRPTT